MALYNDTDFISKLSKNWKDIKKLVQQKRQELDLESKTKDIHTIHNLILNYVIQNRRKVYGGYALNILLLEKDKNDAIYTEDDNPDIDFYSPEPLFDLEQICLLLYSNGYKNIVGKEAQHQETFSIFVDNLQYCDITYVPKNIYSRMQFITIKNITITHPTFLTIDYLRMITDPMISYWRFDNDLKSFKRFYLLQKHYNFSMYKNSISVSNSTDLVNIALNIIYKFILNNESIINIGFFGYNYLLNKSNVLNDKSFKLKLKLVPMPYYEFISTNYRTDALELIKLLNKNDLLKSKNIVVKEFYPFFQLTGHHVEIYFGDDMIAKIYNHNKKCTPYIDVEAINFNKEIIENEPKKFIRMGSFQLNILYMLTTAIKGRVDNDEDETELNYTLIYHLIEIRNYYLEKYNKTIFDDTIFKEFVINCIGFTITPEKQRDLIIKERKKNRQRMVIRFEPNEGDKHIEPFNFSNSSGNQINNIKNLKLGKNENDENNAIE